MLPINSNGGGSSSRPAIHLRPHPVRPPALFALPAFLSRALGRGSTSSGSDGRRLRFEASLPAARSAARRLLRPLSLLVLLLLTGLYLLGGSLGPRRPAAVADLAPEETARLSTVLTALRAGNVSLAEVPVTHSDTLGPHLAHLDRLFQRAYADEGSSRGGKATGLEGRSYRPPVFAPALSPAQYARFEHLLTHTTSDDASNGGRVLFTSVLLNVEPLAADLFGTLVGLADFLGPDRFGLSIVEGPSSDGTAHLFLEVLVPVLLAMGVPPSALYLSLDRPSADFASHNRIAVLAGLREEAVAPLRSDRPARWRTVVFFNDVWWSLSMGLEMLSQHVKQGADMSCAWDLLWGNDYFYDTWVARDVHTGDLYHSMGTTWSPSTDLFPTSPISRKRNAAHLPFQAYACWNGIAVFQSSTFLGSPASAPSAKSEPPIHFRRSDAAAGECAQAEVSLLCKDLWRQKAFGPEARAAKLLVVPGVRVAYERHVAEGVRVLDKATVGGLIEPDVGRSGWSGRRDREQVSWVNKPPAKVRCHPWPEKDGLGGVNVWEQVAWIDPLDG